MRDDGTEAELDAWMARLAGGERSAFDPLFRALYPRALRLARARLGAPHAADVAQSALLKVFDRASEFTPGCPVLPWFYAITANEVRAAGRRARSPAAAGEPQALESLAADGDPERELLDRELRRALERAVESLDATTAEAIYAVLGRGPRPAVESPTFRKRVSRAYARLRLLLGGSYGK